MSILGAIGGLVSSAFGDIFSTAGNIYSTAQANAANRDLWREQAAYNTPKNQMLRYQEAGLNPNLVYSQGNPGNMASSPTMQAPKIDFNPMKSFALSATMKNMVEQNKNLQAQNRLIESQADLAKANADNVRYETEFNRRRGTSKADSAVPRLIKSVLYDYFKFLDFDSSRLAPKKDSLQTHYRR